MRLAEYKKEFEVPATRAESEFALTRVDREVVRKECERVIDGANSLEDEGVKRYLRVLMLLETVPTFPTKDDTLVVNNGRASIHGVGVFKIHPDEDMYCVGASPVSVVGAGTSDVVTKTTNVPLKSAKKHAMGPFELGRSKSDISLHVFDVTTNADVSAECKFWWAPPLGEKQKKIPQTAWTEVAVSAAPTVKTGFLKVFVPKVGRFWIVTTSGLHIPGVSPTLVVEPDVVVSAEKPAPAPKKTAPTTKDEERAKRLKQNEHVEALLEEQNELLRAMLAELRNR